jgi:Tol biopolymer transport system component
VTDLAAVIPQFPTLLVYGLGAVALMAIGVLLALLLEALCMLALGIHFAQQVRRGDTPKVAVLALVAAISGAAALPLTAQGAGQQVRTIEPGMTRLFGSDSLEIRTFGGPTLSPDGQWVLFVTQAAEAASLWVAPTAGGDPVRLTSGRYLDGYPAWLPSGDRIAFISNRPSAPGTLSNYVMVLPFDPRTGQAAGPPRQVTLEAMLRYAVSPDGQWIAYSTISTLMVIPSTGGTARMLLEAQVGNITSVRWSPDAAFVYFGQRRTGTMVRQILRVPVAGGSAQEVGTVPYSASTFAISPGAEFVLTRVGEQGPPPAPLFEVATVEGRPIARFTLPRGMSATTFTPDGRGLMAVQADMVAPIRIVPVAGGPARQLTEARSYDWPLGWSQDGSRLYVQTEANGHNAVLEIPVNGGPARQVPIPSIAREAGIWPDGQYLHYSVTDSSQSGDLRNLVIRRLSDGQTRVVTRALHSAIQPRQPLASGPGGWDWNGDELLYFERRGDQIELRSTPPEGPARLLRSFPASLAVRSSFGVHGSRIAYTEKRGDSTAVLVADGQGGRPRLLATIAGQGNGPPTWSHDGRWLALDCYSPGYGVVLIGVGTNATVTTAPRVLEAGPQAGWQIQWLPDDRAFTVFGMTGEAMQTQVFLVSLREGERPVALTRDDPSMRWGYSLSPDGRYVAYPAEIPRGSSIWRLDLGDVLAEGRRGTRR